MAVYKCKCGHLFNDCSGKAEIEKTCPLTTANEKIKKLKSDHG